MTIDQMMLLSHVLLGLMIFFLIAAGIVFFVFDIRRAWRILTGKKISGKSNNKEIIKKQDSTASNPYKGNDVTTMLKDLQAKTTLLAQQNVTARQDEKEIRNEIVMDITLIHTEVIL